MPTRRYISQTSKIIRKSWFLLPLLLTLTSCFSNTVWNIPPDEFLARLKRGDTAFLRTIDYKSVHLDEVMRLGPNAPYYLSFVYRDLGMSELSRAMLRMEWRRGSGFCQEEAGRLLVADYLAENDYPKAEDAARQVFAVYRQRDVFRGLLVALYWQHKDSEVLTALREIETFKSPDGTPVRDRELALFRAAASARLGAEGWQKLFVKLFTSQPASDLHVRAMEFLTQEASREAGFTKPELTLFAAKRDLALGKFTEAIKAFRPLAEDKDPLILTKWDLRDLARAYIAANEPLTGAKVLEALATSLRAGTGTSAQLYAAYQSLGDLYRAAGYYGSAIDAYQQALPVAADGREQDRTIWYVLNSQMTQSPAGTVPLLATYAKEWHDPSYFDGLLSDLCTALIEHRHWEALSKAYTALDGYADKVTLSRYAFDLGSAIHAGLLRPSDSIQTESALFHRVIQLDADLYYIFLAAARLDVTPAFLTGTSGMVATSQPLGSENTDRENLIMGFFGYGLYREAYAMARQHIHELGPATIQLIARNLSQEGHLIQALRLLENAIDTTGYHPTARDLSLLYPQPYLSAIRSIAQKNHLRVPVFYALVREESYFDPTIVSSAGAVGLSQLMPATAADVSQRMRLKDPDLKNPDDNLSIGGYYFGHLLDYFHGNTEQALFAYNAGYHNVERWITEYGSLPPALFLEAVPFGQTQGYGRKILVSAVVYGYLYYGLRPVDVIKEILPGF